MASRPSTPFWLCALLGLHGLGKYLGPSAAVVVTLAWYFAVFLIIGTLCSGYVSVLAAEDECPGSSHVGRMAWSCIGFGAIGVLATHVWPEIGRRYPALLVHGFLTYTCLTICYFSRYWGHDEGTT